MINLALALVMLALMLCIGAAAGVMIFAATGLLWAAVAIPAAGMACVGVLLGEAA